MGDWKTCPKLVFASSRDCGSGSLCFWIQRLNEKMSLNLPEPDDNAARRRAWTSAWATVNAKKNDKIINSVMRRVGTTLAQTPIKLWVHCSSWAEKGMRMRRKMTDVIGLNCGISRYRLSPTVPWEPNRIPNREAPTTVVDCGSGCYRTRRQSVGRWSVGGLQTRSLARGGTQHNSTLTYQYRDPSGDVGAVGGDLR